MSLPGGIRTRIVLVLVGIVAGALGTAYMIVVPSLERRLVDARLEPAGEARRAAREDAPRRHAPLAGPGRELRGRDELARRRVQRPLEDAAVARRRQADSRTQSSRDVASDPIALAALDVRGRRARAAWTARTGADYAEVAVPVRRRTPSCCSRSALADSLATVRDRRASGCSSRRLSRSCSR